MSLNKIIKIDWCSPEAYKLKSVMLTIAHVASVVLMGFAGCLIFTTSNKAPEISECAAIWSNICSHYIVSLLTVVFVLIETIYNYKDDRNSYKIRKKNDELQNEVDDCDLLKRNVSSIIKLYLGSVANVLKTSHRERISFYRLSDDGKFFTIVARDSANPKYEFYKRDTFSVDEGVIGLARETGSAYVTSLPSYDDNPGEYIAASNKKFFLSKTRVKELTMKARFYYAYKFASHNRVDYNSIVVIESMNPKFKEEAELKAVFDRDKEFIYELVKNFGKYMPYGDLARKEAL